MVDTLVGSELIHTWWPSPYGWDCYTALPQSPLFSHAHMHIYLHIHYISNLPAWCSNIYYIYICHVFEQYIRERRCQKRPSASSKSSPKTWTLALSDKQCVFSLCLSCFLVFLLSCFHHPFFLSFFLTASMYCFRCNYLQFHTTTTTTIIIITIISNQ